MTLVDRDILARQLAYRLAAEINLALAESNMSLKQLAGKIGESEAYLKRVLAADDNVANVIKMRLIADVAWATGRWISISVSPI